jgi:hypothetical protein
MSPPINSSIPQVTVTVYPSFRDRHVHSAPRDDTHEKAVAVFMLKIHPQKEVLGLPWRVFWLLGEPNNKMGSKGTVPALSK